MTLAEAAMETPARIVGFSALPEDERLRLSSLGLREEAVVTKLIKTPLRDPVECLVGPQLLALEERLLPLILVEPLVRASP